MSGTQDSKRHYLILISVLSLSIIALLITSILVIKPKIEKDLTQKVTEALKQQGINADVSFSGRDGVIKGTINKSADIAKAEESAYKVCGIHFIDNQLITREDQSEPPKDITLNQAAASPQEYSEATTKEPSNSAASKKNSDDTLETSAIEGKESIENTKPEGNIGNDKKKSVKESKPETPATIVLAAEKTEKEEKQSTSSNITNNDTPTDKNPKIVSAKGNVNQYEKMLAAMTDYNKNTKKSRNRASLSNNTPFNIDITNITFVTGGSNIKSSSYKALDKLADRLNDSDKTFNLKVTAVDSELAFRRAKSLRTYLVAKGIKKRRLIITGKGDSQGHSISISEED